VQKWKVYIILVVYTLVSLSPTIYFHGCCCGTEQSWFVPIDDCCDDHEHGHESAWANDCCQEESLQLVVDDQPATGLLRVFISPTIIEKLSKPLVGLELLEFETSFRREIKAPPLIQERTILFSQWLFYDDVV
jgi:hypothetical protein